MLEIKNLELEIGHFKLGQINFNVKKGEYFIIIGESGNGKTLLLQSIGGYYENIKGSIVFDGKDISKKDIEKKNIGVVYQDYGLFPFLNVRDNIAFGLKIRNYKKKIISEKVSEYIKKFNLSEIKYRYPKNLSGGESQRTAIARALITEPDILLLDEPLNSLDSLNKQKIIEDLKKINKELKLTIIHVTHDINEALQLGDRIGVIKKGKLIRILNVEELKDKNIKNIL